VRWTAVVPVKGLPTAKSRLGSRPDEERAALALAFARDAVAAVLATEGVEEVIVVTSDPVVADALAGPRVLVLGEPPTDGLNAALVHGADLATDRDPTRGVAAICADLPALRPTELSQVLQAAGEQDRAFVADTAGVGTTLLSARPGHALRPAFGPGSAEAHQAGGAAALVGSWPSVRRDVDEPGDLEDAVELGVGRWTSAALGVD
jgi:2-phospho-L-lactate guanylyltransferase